MEVDGHWQLGSIAVSRLAKDVDGEAVFTLFQCWSDYYELFRWSSWAKFRRVYNIFTFWYCDWWPKPSIACWRQRVWNSSKSFDGMGVFPFQCGANDKALGKPSSWSRRFSVGRNHVVLECQIRGMVANCKFKKEDIDQGAVSGLTKINCSYKRESNVITISKRTSG